MQIDIKAAQRRLNELGFGPLVVDGIKGPRTAAAVTRFKTSIGFKATSQLGSLTYAALMEERSSEELPQGRTGPAQDFVGAAERLTDHDIPRIAALIGVGEDELHAVLDVETAGGGFDSQNRPKMLFEPHVFWRRLGPGPARDQAVGEGLAYPKWGQRPYPRDSYSRLHAAMRIHTEAALCSASWGLGQVMGFNAAMCGYDTAADMVAAFVDSEAAQLEAMVRFIDMAGLDDELRRQDWTGFARGYNGPGYARHGYHLKLAERFKWWRGRPDTKAEEA